MMVSMVSTLVGLVIGGFVGTWIAVRVMEGPTDRYLTDWEVQEILEAEKEA